MGPWNTNLPNTNTNTVPETSDAMECTYGFQYPLEPFEDTNTLTRSTSTNISQMEITRPYQSPPMPVPRLKNLFSPRASFIPPGSYSNPFNIEPPTITSHSNSAFSNAVINPITFTGSGLSLEHPSKPINWHSPNPFMVDPSHNPSVNPSFICNCCGKMFNDKYDLQNHIKQNSLLLCELCGKHCADLEEFRRHHKANHRDSRLSKAIKSKRSRKKDRKR